MAHTTHHLQFATRCITFLIDADADCARILEAPTAGGPPTEAVATVEVARAFYSGLLDRGWAPPGQPPPRRKKASAKARMARAMAGVESPEEAERAMQRMEAEGDRAQSRREEANKAKARAAMEGK